MSRLGTAIMRGRQKPMTALIETHRLSKKFGSLTAVQDVSLRVDAGQILTLLGPNGAGKTTTIRMLASILRPTRGQAHIAGFKVAEDPSGVRRSVGLLTEHHGLYTRMRPVSYLEFFASIYGMDPEVSQERIADLLNRFDLIGSLDMRLGQFSRGMRQKLALARALLHDPAVLLLDEPTSAMDPASARLVRESIVGLRSSNRAIIVCTHNLAEAEALADTIAVIRRGRIIAQGSGPELKQEMLGDPIMELRFAGPLNGAVQALPEVVTLLDRGSNWIRYRTADPISHNPAILRRMADLGLSVVTLQEVGRSLEEVYLQVVSAPEGGQRA